MDLAKHFEVNGRRLANQSLTWIHAVSVGEVAIALKLARRMRALDPAFCCVLTTTTTTGFAVAESEASEWIEVIYNPLDFWPIMRRALALIRPKRIVLVEAEVWPNLAAEARRRRIPIALVNARLSPRSERRFRRFKVIVAPTFRSLDLICVQEAGDIERWVRLGVERDRIKLVGSIKYDPIEETSDANFAGDILRNSGIDPARAILFGGSTHPGEEEILARVFRKLREEFPSLLLIIAPRHVERTAEIRRSLAERGLTILLRSELDHSEKSSSPDCLLLDTTGELRNWYAVATVVFVGKSLTAHGGQNPVEPILAGRPVIFGPHMENFSSLAQALLAAHGAVEVRDAAELGVRVAELLRDPAGRRRLVDNAEQVVAAHRRATERTAKLLVSLGTAGKGGD